MSVVQFGYWDSRGKAESVRLMMEYLGVNYREKRFKYGDAPDFSKDDWRKRKDFFGLDFPNLPYLIDGDVKLTETFAILRYLARKHGELYPQTDEENIKCDVLQGVMYNFRHTYTETFYNRSNFENAKANFLADFPENMNGFEKILGHGKWLVGNKLMFVDFWFAEYMSCLQLCLPGCLSKYPNARRYCNEFDSLERINAYRTSGRFQKLPILAKRAVGIWGQKE